MTTTNPSDTLKLFEATTDALVRRLGRQLMETASLKESLPGLLGELRVAIEDALAEAFAAGEQYGETKPNRETPRERAELSGGLAELEAYAQHLAQGAAGRRKLPRTQAVEDGLNAMLRSPLPEWMRARFERWAPTDFEEILRDARLSFGVVSVECATGLIDACEAAIKDWNAEAEKAIASVRQKAGALQRQSDALPPPAPPRKPRPDLGG